MLTAIEAKIDAREPITTLEAARLFREASDEDLSRLATCARDLRHPKGRATYLKMAIVNYTNVCVARCDYCSFYKLPKEAGTYLLTFEQVCARIQALVSHGGTMVGFNGGFHPKLKIEHYGKLFQGVRERFPDLEFYEMTVAEFMYVCKTSRVSYDEGAATLASYGVKWVTGGGAEILTDAFRLRHSPLKYTVTDFYDAQRAILAAGLGSTATMVIGFDETLDERLEHLQLLRDFQDSAPAKMPSFLCWTYKAHNNALGGEEIDGQEYVRWLAICRLFLHNIDHIRTSVLTQNANALLGLTYGADDFDLPTEDEVTQTAGATISHDFDAVLQSARSVGYEPIHRAPLPSPGTSQPAP